MKSEKQKYKSIEHCHLYLQSSHTDIIIFRQSSMRLTCASKRRQAQAGLDIDIQNLRVPHKKHKCEKLTRN